MLSWGCIGSRVVGVVACVSIGKGFQGPMKRWGFGGQSASHGTTKAHRSHGSTGSSQVRKHWPLPTESPACGSPIHVLVYGCGCCEQNPGRVFKGKKMAGRMGGNTVTVECLQVRTPHRTTERRLTAAAHTHPSLAVVPGLQGRRQA